MAEPTKITPGSEIDNFIFEKEIGSGAFASVWKAHHKVSKTSVAIKTIEKRSLNNDVARTRLVREIALFKSMDHPFISEFFCSFEDESYYYLVMEFVENGNLLDYVNNNGRLSEDQARRYFGQLVSVLEYLHHVKKVAHRDLKCENVLLDRYHNIRLIDFGLSNQFTELDPKLSTACGSPAYAAPEMIKGNQYTTSADIWSAGILLYAIVAGNLPYDDDNIQRLLQKIVYTEVFYPSFLSVQLKDLLQKMICKNPDERITIEKIKEHPWFSQSEYSALLDDSVFDEMRKGNTEIDTTIIQKMNELNADSKLLSQSLLRGDSNETTVLYRILRRQKITEMMKDIKHKKNNAFGTKPIRLPTSPMVVKSPFPKPVMLAQKKPPNYLMRPGFQGNSPPAPAQLANGPTNASPRVLIQQRVHPEGRRMSRPIAFKKPIMQNQAQPNTVVSHEM